MNKSPLILTGSISIDRIMNFRGRYKDLIQPDKIHVLSISILIDELKDSHGGTAANIAYSLALLGDSPILLGSIGEKDKRYFDKLHDVGVVTDYIHLSKLPTATYTVLTDSDDNQVGGFYPGAMSDSSMLSLKPWYNKDPLVVISANDPQKMNQFVEECHTHKLKYCYDVGQQITNIEGDDVKLGLSKCEILFVNDYEFELTAKKSGRTKAGLEKLVPIIVTTLGPKGSKITGSSVGKPLIIEPVPGLDPLDPTGAGDAYRAGFLYGFTRGMDLQTCGELGSVTAAYSVETFGTQEHHFNMAKVSKRFSDTYDTKLTI